ncbi:MAG: DHH family phosphoesterase [Clostridia bacterium]|nr:DHH family phosphoesterase [Clostridia bacterium]
MTDLQRAAKMLKAADGIMILTHTHPDGDTVGAGFALFHALKALGKRCFVANADPIPPSLLSVSGAERLPVEFEPDFIVAVDVAETSLLGALAPYGERADLCVDHHKSNKRYAGFTLLDEAASSAGEIVYDLLGLLGVAMTPEIASALYAALSTDTGCFRYRNNTPKTMRAAAETMEAGADFGSMNKIFFETVSKERALLLRELYGNMEIFSGGRLVVSFIDIHNFPEDDYDGLSGELRKIEGVAAAVLLRRTGADEYKLSARSNAGFDCSALCAVFGGGGHVGAAGATVTGDLADCVGRVKAAMEAELRRNA